MGREDQPGSCGLPFMYNAVLRGRHACWCWHLQSSLLSTASFAAGHLVLFRHKVCPRQHICFSVSHLMLQQLQQTDLFSRKHQYLCSELEMPPGHHAYARPHFT